MKSLIPTLIVATALVSLSGCTSPESGDQNDVVTYQEVGASSGKTVDMHTGAGSSRSLPGRHEADASDGGTPETRPMTEIPLTPSVYVLENTPCENPANAFWRVWDGEGLSGSSTRKCRAEVVASDGDTYTLSNDCENIYDGSRTAEEITMTVVDQVHFRIGKQTFASCSTAQVPAALRSRLLD